MTSIFRVESSKLYERLICVSHKDSLDSSKADNTSAHIQLVEYFQSAPEYGDC